MDQAPRPEGLLQSSGETSISTVCAGGRLRYRSPPDTRIRTPHVGGCVDKFQDECYVMTTITQSDVHDTIPDDTGISG